MDLVVLDDGRDAGAPAFLPAFVRDALPRLFVETALPMALAGGEGHLLAVNSGFCALLARSAPSLVGLRLSDIVHPDERVTHLAGWRGLLSGISRADRVDARLLRADGATVTTVLYRTVLSTPSAGSPAIGLVKAHDASALSARHDRAQWLLDVSRRLAATSTVEAVAEIAAHAAVDVVGDGAWLWLSGDEGSLHLAAVGHRDDVRGAALRAAVSRAPIDAGVLHTSVSLNRPLRLVGSEAHEASEELAGVFAPYADAFGVTGLLVLPLSVNDTGVGVLGVVRDGGAGSATPYTDSEVSEVSALARVTAAGLHHARAVRSASARELRVRAVLDAIPVMAGVLDARGRVVDVNAAWRRASMQPGRSQHDPVGRDYLEVWDRAAARGVMGAADIANGVRAVLDGERKEFSGDSAYAYEDDVLGTQASDLWLHVHAAVLDAPGSAPLVVVDHLDITDRKRLEVRLAYEATHDPLTRLPNRTLLIDRINQALARDRRAGLRTAVLFCDLDDFKLINDTHGHDTGDAVLCAVARRFGATVRASDTVARIGGDEFVVLIEALSDVDEAVIVADKLAQSLREPVPELPSLPGVSVGVAVSHDGATAETLLRASDATMYAVKQSGRGQVSVADETS